MRKTRNGIMFQLAGVWFAIGTWFGNCFAPAFVVEWHGIKKRWERDGKKGMPAWATITIRTNDHTETKIYFRGWCGFNFNSEHIAEKWGEAQDMDFGTIYIYNGILGKHDSI